MQKYTNRRFQTSFSVKFVQSTPPLNRKSLSLPLTVTVALFTVFLYFCPDISPEKYWYMAFLPFLIPLMWVLNLILLAFWGWRKSWYTLIPVLILAGGFKYFQRT